MDSRLISFLLIALAAAAADHLGPGTLLVADKKLDDPNFRQTVIVIADYRADGTLGLILNRRSEIPLSRALEKWAEAAPVKDPLYLGGPVGRAGMFALLRSKAAPTKDAKRVIGDIHLVTNRAGLAPHLADGPAQVRVYSGYTGWAPDQLESELSDGAWHVLPPNAKVLFDESPESLWQRLSHAAEMQVARRQGTNLYPTPWTVIRCLGSPCSSFALIPAM